MRRSWKIKWRDFKHGIKNLITWFPIIWGDRNWDYAYTYEILRKKIILQRKYFEKSQLIEGWENQVKQLKFCEKILNTIIADDYILYKKSDYKYKRDRKILYLMLEKYSDSWWD